MQEWKVRVQKPAWILGICDHMSFIYDDLLDFDWILNPTVQPSRTLYLPYWLMSTGDGLFWCLMARSNVED